MMKTEVPQEDMGQGEVLGNGRLIAECFCDGMPLSPPPRWCGPCKILGPRLEKVVAKQHGKVVMAKVDIDDHTDLAIEYEVRVSRLAAGQLLWDAWGSQDSGSCLRAVRGGLGFFLEISAVQSTLWV